MAQSTSHPDCVHCRFVQRHKHGEYRCRQHNMTLHSPVSLLCKMISLPESKDTDYQTWFNANVDSESLDASMLYTCVETKSPDDNGGYHLQIDIEALAPLTQYQAWSAGTFWQRLRDLRKKKPLIAQARR